jgi:hypothetical protein
VLQLRKTGETISREVFAKNFETEGQRNYRPFELLANRKRNSSKREKGRELTITSM